MAATCVIVVYSNVIGAGKAAQLAVDVPFRTEPPPFTFGAGILFFPPAYVLGDVLTEVYGYARARRVIWTAFEPRRRLPPPWPRSSPRCRRRRNGTRTWAE
jgi:uncharacterized PurR-regulated membrane protein YhhQ (DUF165 family)